MRVGKGRVQSRDSVTYRPEIDGLRAVAVIAVLINHLGSQWLSGGFLGVDLFFVISGYVVTASLARREEVNWRQMLAGFYARRFRRLLPALLLMVSVTSILFGLFVSSVDDQYAMSMRTGLASLFGVSNISLLLEGNYYFDFAAQFNPFLHTWSLGVEEQFYLLWPLLVMLCGVGFKGSRRICLLRLLLCTVFLSVGSFVLFLSLSRSQAAMAAFYLMPARFWELAAGAIVFLLQALWPTRPLRSPCYPIADFLLFILVLIGFFLSADQAVQYKPFFVASTAGLLVSLSKNSQLGRFLGSPICLSIGIASYSLYLWHWPLIVLLRWTLGINAFTIVPVILAIALSTMGSYWVEAKFRYGKVRAHSFQKTLLIYPLTTLVTALLLAMESRFAEKALFLGTSSRSTENFTVGRSIRGTTVSTSNCFVDPDSPLAASKEYNKCQAGTNPHLPTLFFEGDSIAHSLIPMIEQLYQSGRYNVSFFGRGGCVTPFVKPWVGNRHLLPRYQSCSGHAQIREQAVLSKIKPGDQLVLATTNAYVQGTESQASYTDAISRLAEQLERKGAGLILVSPFPNFAERELIKTPLSLCFQEWFRPTWAFPQECAPAYVNRQGMVEYNTIMKNLQRGLQERHKNIRVFDPFPILCPPGHGKCSTHLDGTMMFADGLHLTAAGGRYLYPAFQAFLQAVK